MDGAAPAVGRTGWVGVEPARGAIFAAFFIGVVGVMVAGLQPVLLGALLAAGRISAPELGHAATLELVALGLGAGLGGGLLEGRPLRPILAVTGVVYLVANLATLEARGEALALVRGLAGLPGGVMIWAATGMIVRAPNPARWSGAYLAIQTFAQLAVSGTIGVLVTGSASAAPLVMAALGLAVVGAAALLPWSYPPLPKEPGGTGLPPLRGWGVLAAGMLLMACIVGAWVYLEPLGRQAGVSASTIALATPLSLACQVAGATCATLVAGRAPWFQTLTAAGLVLAATTLGLSTVHGAAGFLGLQALFGFVWLFILPFGTPLAIEMDPTRRTALLSPGANLVGAAIGPLCASLLVGDSDARAALQLCAALAFAGVALIIALHLSRRRALSAA